MKNHTHKENTYKDIQFRFENRSETEQYLHQKIITLKAENKSVDEMSKILSVTKNKINNTLQHMRVIGFFIPNDLKALGGLLSEEEELEKADLIEAYLDDDMTINAISKHLGHSSYYIEKLVYKHLIVK